MKHKSIFRVPIMDIKYIIHDKETKCIIHWFNPISGNTQKSVGVAYCNPDDDFNTTIGQRLSESRAKYSLYRTYMKNITDAKNIIFAKYSDLSRNEMMHEIKLISSLDDD